jgi:hypothetical protein
MMDKQWKELKAFVWQGYLEARGRAVLFPYFVPIEETYKKVFAEIERHEKKNKIKQESS